VRGEAGQVPGEQVAQVEVVGGTGCLAPYLKESCKYMCIRKSLVVFA
jgi:hypothetical protein